MTVYPIGIGQLGGDTLTPTMVTTISDKRANPTSTPTANIRARYKANGIDLPAVVPAGPDNPMGHHAIRLAAYGGVYLLHGTNADFGIGMRVSSGCIRLRDGDIETLFRQVKPEPRSILSIRQSKHLLNLTACAWLKYTSRCPKNQ